MATDDDKVVMRFSECLNDLSHVVGLACSTGEGDKQHQQQRKSGSNRASCSHNKADHPKLQNRWFAALENALSLQGTHLLI